MTSLSHSEGRRFKSGRAHDFCLILGGGMPLDGDVIEGELWAILGLILSRREAVFIPSHVDRDTGNLGLVLYHRNFVNYS